MNHYLVPVTSQNVNGQTVNAPKYLSTDMANLPFTAMPYGAEPWALVTLQNPNAALSTESDVYTFPNDVSATLSNANPSDVSALSTFLAAANIPSDQIVTGMTWAAALQVIAKIFLTAQALYGVTGSAIFADGVGLDATIADSGVASIAPEQNVSIKVGGVGKLQDGAGSGQQLQQQSQQSGPFDFSSVSADDLIGDTLNAVSQQFKSTVNLGSF